MAARIERVPANPATNFIDALQSISFMYLCLHAEDGGGHTLGQLIKFYTPTIRRTSTRVLSQRKKQRSISLIGG